MAVKVVTITDDEDPDDAQGPAGTHAQAELGVDVQSRPPKSSTDDATGHVPSAPARVAPATRPAAPDPRPEVTAGVEWS